MSSKQISVVGKTAASSAGVILGACTVLCPITFKPSPDLDTISHESYGDDAYTGIQNAAADTGNNIYCVLSIAGFGIPHQFFSPVTT